jgi:hypothetical protein
LIPNPIVKVLSTLSSHEVRLLLMGGQACVLYGAAEFSRDCDILLNPDDENYRRLQDALDKLGAENIAVPTFDPEWLERGHAVHFRCRQGEAKGMRVDVMTRLRGVEEFAELWDRRTSIVVGDVGIDLLSLPDLFRA